MQDVPAAGQAFQEFLPTGKANFAVLLNRFTCVHDHEIYAARSRRFNDKKQTLPTDPSSVFIINAH